MSSKVARGVAGSRELSEGAKALSGRVKVCRSVRTSTSARRGDGSHQCTVYRAKGGRGAAYQDHQDHQETGCVHGAPGLVMKMRAQHDAGVDVCKKRRWGVPSIHTEACQVRLQLGWWARGECSSSGGGGVLLLLHGGRLIYACKWVLHSGLVRRRGHVGSGALLDAAVGQRGRGRGGGEAQERRSAGGARARARAVHLWESELEVVEGSSEGRQQGVGNAHLEIFGKGEWECHRWDTSALWASVGE
jgi:hypothetical protein